LLGASLGICCGGLSGAAYGAYTTVARNAALQSVMQRSIAGSVGASALPAMIWCGMLCCIRVCVTGRYNRHTQSCEILTARDLCYGPLFAVDCSRLSRNSHEGAWAPFQQSMV